MSAPLFSLHISNNMLISGPTSSGKTTFIKDIFLNKAIDLTDIQRVLIFTKTQSSDIWADIKKLLKIPVTFFNSISDIEKKIMPFSIVVVDDFMTDASSNKTLRATFNDLFTVWAHHKNLINIITLQNLFYDGFRTIRLNSQFIVLLPNPVDRNLATRFFSQISSSKVNTETINKAYEISVRKNRAFIIKFEPGELDIDFFADFFIQILFLNKPDLDKLRQNTKGYKIEYINE